MYDFKGRTVVVTGGASGIGRATALRFTSAGANVVIGDLNDHAGEEVAKLADPSGRHCIFRRTDVAEESEIKALIDLALARFQRLDVTVNNAGIGGAIGSIETIAASDWDKTQNICLRSVLFGIKHSVGPMRSLGKGAIVSTASIAGLDGYNGLHAYCAAKAGVINLTRSAALEFAVDKIRVNCVAPGTISTPMTFGGLNDKEAAERAFVNAQPLAQVGRPDDVASAILFLASDEAAFITGHALVVDGGATAGAISTSRPEIQLPAVGSHSGFSGPSFEGR